MDKKIKVTEIEIGDVVVCDFCNEDYTDSEKKGGCLIGSYAVCPKCEVGVTDRHEIDAMCPDDTEFRKWVLDLRGGKNTIEIYTS